MPPKTHSLFLATLLAVSSTIQAQSPKLYLKFDGNLADSAPSPIITSIVGARASGVWTPSGSDYGADRNGTASKALTFSGSRSLQLVASSSSGNSNQALGLRNASGTNTSFTLSVWVMFTSAGSGQSYSTIFGNLGSGAGTLHAGLNNNSSKTHFGFDGNDVNGGTNDLNTNVWYHIAYVYDTTTQTSGSSSPPSQRIYINGVPEVSRWNVTNTLKVADLLLGNWGVANDTNNDFKGRLDDVAVYNTALKPDQIQALFNGVSPTSLPAAGTYSPPKLPGVFGTAGSWGVREIKAYPGINYGTLVNADRIIRAYATTPSGTVAQYLAPVINFLDDEGAGNAGYFPNEGDFGTNTLSADDNYLMIARSAVRIPTAGKWTFGFRGDDGSRLRVLGKKFASSTRLYTGNPADPAHNGDGICVPNSTGDSNTLGVVNFATAGDYNLEFVWWESGGGSSVEVFAAPGAKTGVDSAFQLIGNTAAGGLELVRDPDTIPAFTANGASTLFIHSGLPANFTLAWSVANPTTTLSIDQGIGTVAQSGSMVLSAPAATKTYTITATTPLAGGTNDVVAKTVTVYVNSPPFINSFTANDNTVVSGAAVTLSWSVDGATSLTLNPGGINVTGQTSRVVNPAVDTTYTLTATNPAGSSQQTVFIDIGLAPILNSFATTDANPMYGAETSLVWNTTNATTLSINQGVGAISNASGSVAVAPLVTTTYTLSVSNEYGISTAAVTINQPPPVGVDASGFTVTRYNASTPFPFTGMGYLQSADALIAGTNLANTTVLTGVTTINYSDGVDGDFTAGNNAFPGGIATGLNFAIKVTGTLVVNTPGEYTFLINSDDGARLLIDGQDVIVDDSTHAPNANSGRVTITKPTVSIELVYYNAPSNGGSAGAEIELAWVRPNLSWSLITTATAATPVVRGQVLISEFMADNKNTLLDEDGVSPDWIEIWNSTPAAVNLGTPGAAYYLTNDPLVPNKWALPDWSLNANNCLLVFASSKDRRPAQAVAGQDNPGTTGERHLHTNFNLQIEAGNYLALMRDDGTGGYTPITVFSGYPAQKEDVGYGSSDSEGYIGYMEVPTPGYPNDATYIDFVADTTFTDATTGLPRLRGRYTTPFDLVISTATPGATIRYTLDGSSPTLNYGNIYSGPIHVSGTKTVRAAAFKLGWKATNIDTQTYLFLDDVVNQTSNTAIALGFPSGSVNGQVFRYGLNLANVTAGGGTLQSLKDALAAAPTVCMTTDIGNLVNVSTGIYVNPGQHGLEWERPTSIEYINAQGASEFQIDCGVRIRGGASRSTGNPKHAFHLYFRSSLYDGNLNYRLFGTNGASEFSQLDMRCEQNYSWSKDGSNQNTLLREEWSRKTQGDMGQPYARDGYFHLYLNGIYWGVFDWEERTESAYGETYLGGLKENVDSVKSAGSTGGYNTEMTDGNFIAWKSLFDQAIALKNDAGTESSRTAKYLQMQGLNADGTRNTSYPVLLDVDNLIDFLLVIFYDGSFDAPMSTFLQNASNNWFGVRDRLGSRGFVFFAHDNEHGMDSQYSGLNNPYNRVGPWGGSGANNWNQTMYNSLATFAKSNPQYLHEMLCYSAEYRQRFADRVQRHYFNNGALTTTPALARVEALATQVDAIIHAEAARWGSTSLHRNTWLNTGKATVLNFINNGGNFPTTSPANTQTNFGAQARTSMIVTQLRGYQDPVGTPKPLYPAATLAAPTFSGSFGGPVTNPYSFQITDPTGTGTLYYTVNGTDPRATGGGVAAGAFTGASPIPVTLTSTATVRARIFTGTDWSPLVEADYLVGALGNAGNLVISEIYYNPPGSGNLEQFVELANISDLTVDLTGVHFTLGIQFTFPDGFTLPPGGRAVVVSDSAAFVAAFPGLPGWQIAGIFANGTILDPNGERLQLLDATGAVIRDFTYDDKTPWPEEPDGAGPSLVLKHPATNPDHALAGNWRASGGTGPGPGIDDNHATVTLGNLLATYDGSDKAATATTSPGGLTVSLTYDGSASAPTAAGSYAVVATVNDPNYEGTASGTLVIGKAPTTVTLGNLAPTYDGSPKTASATTSPAGLTVSLTYDGSATAPTVVGSYAVVATVNDPNHEGTASGILLIGKATATVTLGNLAPTYDGSPKTVSATTSPAGLTVDLTYDGSATAPTAAGSYAVVATVNDPNHEGTASGTLLIGKASATVTLGNLAPTYDGNPKTVSATTSPAGLTVGLTYDGSATAPTVVGSYAVVATVNDPNYEGTASGTLVIGKAPTTVTLGNLAPTYDGSPKTVSATTSPADLTVGLTYDGSATAPTTAGSYAVVATVNDPNHESTASGTLVIGKATATVILGNLAPTYDGSPKTVSATTSPADLTVGLTYDGSATAPTAAGSYAVVATVNDPNHEGTASGTLVIGKATATVILGNLAPTYDGSPKMVSATTSPADLTVGLTYDGSATAPTAAGSYAVVATVNDPNHEGTASGTLLIGKATATVTLGNLAPTYDGNPKTVSATTSPAGLMVGLTYDGSPTAPTAAGSYAVVATVNDPNHEGTASGTLVIGETYASWAARHVVNDPFGTGDADGDGWANLAEYYLGTDPQAGSQGSSGVAAARQSLAVEGTLQDFLTITVTHPLGRDDSTCMAEASSNLLQPWMAAVLVSGPTRNPDGTETCVYRHPNPCSADPTQFVRLRFTRLP